MDTKKVLERLIKIADSQQKIINKLAQELPPPQDLKPAPTQKNPQDVLMAALTPALQSQIQLLRPRGGDMEVKFNEGQATQSNYNMVLRTLQKLTNEGKIQQAYELKLLQ